MEYPPKYIGRYFVKQYPMLVSFYDRWGNLQQEEGSSSAFQNGGESLCSPQLATPTSYNANNQAPNNATSKPTFLSCTFTGRVGLSYLTFGLDAVGTIPVGNDVVHGVQFGAGIAAAGISLFGGATGAGLSAGGLGLAFADKSGASIAVHGVELIPVAGNIISAGAALNDIFGSDGIIASYKSCFAGTN